MIAGLLFFNAGLELWQCRKASNALAALKKGLAPEAIALRDGNWQSVPAADLVPDNIVKISLGAVVPADLRLIQGDFASIDQSGLTGESLPVTKKPGDPAYSGSVVKQGEMQAVVIGTGSNTLFGRTAKLVAGAGATSHARKAMYQIGNFLIIAEGDRLQALGDRRGGRRRHSLLGQDGHPDQEPAHRRYAIVKSLQDRGHLVAMTGDGVNDAPALKQADCGTAVSGATDAARGAAALILTAPGLSVINNAIDEARRIFERITPEAAWTAISFPTVALLFSLMTVSAAFSVAGFYDWAARWAATRPLSPPRLLAVLILISAVFSSLVTNDVVVVAMIPLVLQLPGRAGAGSGSRPVRQHRRRDRPRERSLHRQRRTRRHRAPAADPRRGQSGARGGSDGAGQRIRSPLPRHDCVLGSWRDTAPRPRIRPDAPGSRARSAPERPPRR